MKKTLSVISICFLLSCGNNQNPNLGAIMLPVSNTFRAILPAQKEVLLHSLKDLPSASNLPLDSVSANERRKLEQLGLTSTENYQKVVGYDTKNKGAYYQNLYKGYRVILEKDLQPILSKYDLTLTNLYNYKGEIPKESLKHLTDFVPLETYCVFIDKSERFYEHDFVLFGFAESSINKDRTDIMAAMSEGGWNTSVKDAIASFDNPVSLPVDGNLRIVPFSLRDNMFIAADKSQLVSKNSTTVEDIVNSSPDPMVFLKLGEVYIAVTCWGNESNLIK